MLVTLVQKLESGAVTIGAIETHLPLKFGFWFFFFFSEFYVEVQNFLQLSFHFQYAVKFNGGCFLFKFDTAYYGQNTSLLTKVPKTL